MCFFFADSFRYPFLTTKEKKNYYMTACYLHIFIYLNRFNRFQSKENQQNGQNKKKEKKDIL